MKRMALTNYYNFSKKNTNEHICPSCQRKIKPWALTQCSSCNRFFCRSHMEPSVGHNKKCPHCRSKQSAFKDQEPVFGALKTAEHKLNEFRLAESDELEDAIIASIFGNKNLFRVAQENSEQQEENNFFDQQPAEVQPTDVVQPAVPVESPEQQASDNEQSVLDNAAERLSDIVSDAMKKVGLDDEDSYRQILDVVLASNKFFIRTADILGDVMSSNQYYIVGNAMSGGPDFTGFKALDKDTADALQSAWQQLVNSEALEFLPAWHPDALKVNNAKRLQIMQFDNSISRALDTPVNVLEQFEKSGLSKSYLPADVLSFLESTGIIRKFK